MKVSQGFSMIELIFVIVIIGILGVIALPLFSASRDDAQGARIAHDLSICIEEAGASYMMNGSFGGMTQPGATQTLSCKRADKCFNFIENDSAGSLTVLYDSNASGRDCMEAERISNLNHLITTRIIDF
jgi:prepilin-type N-terminal cleavage/methylation domain-containing protein